MKNHAGYKALRLMLFVLVCISIAAGCASFEKQSNPAVVPMIRPGILAGYLKPEALPNSLALLPPPPAKGSAAFALDQEDSKESLALRGTARYFPSVIRPHLLRRSRFEPVS